VASVAVLARRDVDPTAIALFSLRLWGSGGVGATRHPTLYIAVVAMARVRSRWPASWTFHDLLAREGAAPPLVGQSPQRGTVGITLAHGTSAAATVELPFEWMETTPRHWTRARRSRLPS
jgi:hypothetical protein